LVADKRGMRAGRKLSGKALQEHGYVGGGRRGQSQGEGLVRAGSAGGEQIEAR
jgi:hypothetical protein